MSLYKIKDFDPDYRNHFDEQDIIGYDLYNGNEKIGTVDDILVDDSGNFRYLVINTGVWILGKKVMLPIGRSRINHADHNVSVEGLTKESVENLPEYDANALNNYDYDYEERVRGAYRPTATNLETATPVDASASLEYDRNNYAYDRDPALYDINDRDHQNIRLYQERLIANKTRQKTGEVAVGKHVETETQRVSVPIEKERVVIERVAGDTGTAVTPGDAAFGEGEVARVEVYEETPDIHKEAFVREEVRVRKEVDRDTVDAEEQIRREELDVDTQGNPVVRGSENLPKNRR